MSGVEIHANAIETLFTGRSIREVPDTIVLLNLFALVMLLWRLDSRFEGRPVYSAAILAGPAVGAVFISWVLMKYLNVWLPVSDRSSQQLLSLCRRWRSGRSFGVNRDLDGKIERLTLSHSGANPLTPNLALSRRGNGAAEKDSSEYSGQPRARRLARCIGQIRKRIAVSGSSVGRNCSSSRRHNSRWKLEAVDFFNEELLEFLSFNNAILASITDVIIVSDPAGRIVYQNPAAGRLDGYREHPPFATDYFASLLDGRSFAAEFAAVIATGNPFSAEFVPGRISRISTV